MEKQLMKYLPYPPFVKRPNPASGRIWGPLTSPQTVKSGKTLTQICLQIVKAKTHENKEESNPTVIVVQRTKYISTQQRSYQHPKKVISSQQRSAPSYGVKYDRTGSNP